MMMMMITEIVAMVNNTVTDSPAMLVSTIIWYFHDVITHLRVIVLMIRQEW